MSREEYTLFDTELGTCGIAWQESGTAVTCLQLPEKTPRLTAVRLEAREAVAAGIVPGHAGLGSRLDAADRQRRLGGLPKGLCHLYADSGEMGHLYAIDGKLTGLARRPRTIIVK